jgi:hypothetical protein
MVKLAIRSTLDSMPSDTKDKLIAPKISQLTAPTAPDISGERTYLMNSFICNFNLTFVLSNKNRQFLYNIARKAEDSFDEYCRAADSLKAYAATSVISLTNYFSAIRHFEHCLAHLYQAVRCMNALLASSGVKQFDPGDGSILERVCILHNEIKHMDNRFETGKLGDESSFRLFAKRPDGTKSLADSDVTAIANLPMWLTNEGLECAKGSITYAELAQEVRELCAEAEKLSTIQPEFKGEG